MSYSGELRSAPIKFPKAPKPPKGAAIIFAGDKPAKASKPKKPKARKALKVPRTLSYPKVTEKNPLRAPTATELVLGAAGGRRVLKAAGARLAASGGEAVTLGSGLLTQAAIAGVAAYVLASMGLSKLAMKKATKRENAARAADAYRYLRTKLAADQGRPLTKTQLKQTATIFKNELLKLGLSSSDLSGIMPKGGLLSLDAYERR